MDKIKKSCKEILISVAVFIKWIIVASFVGAAGGVVGTLFHKSIDFATELREENGWLLFLLPLGGLIIAGAYKMFKSQGAINTNRVIDAVKTDGNVPFIMAPLIFGGAFITHLLGGSAGREGAALQLGGSIGYNIGKCFRIKKQNVHIIVMSGMSSVFSALFGTPLTAAFFALEVGKVGIIKYAGMLPCIVSSFVAYKISILMGVHPVRFSIPVVDELSLVMLLKIIALSLLCAVVSIIFCYALKKASFYAKKTMKNSFVRIFVCGAIVVLLTLAFGTTDYNGAGMHVITDAINGNAKAEAFLLKILFTAVTIAAGFKGGEIVPAFFVGSTFGCVAGELIGTGRPMGAAIGFVALFCGAVNCPIASVLLALEVFGGSNMMIFALVVAVTYMMSGYFGLYESQEIVYSKLNDDYIDVNAK